MNNLQTLFWGFLGTLFAGLAGFIGKLLLTPNEKIKQLNDIITQHTSLIHNLSDEVHSALAENKLLNKRVEELEDECKSLRQENKQLKEELLKHTNI